MRACIDSLKAETDKQASFHQLLAQQMRTDMENVVNEFHTKQQQFKKITQATIERQHKAKQVQENYVQKAKEKYEFDCQKINSYTAQSSLVQGKELEKVQVKLQRAEQTVQANERDFASFTKALAETTAKWELDWRAFCDKCQDMEETRMDFLKDVMWAYANSVSTVCVSDDEVSFSPVSQRNRLTQVISRANASDSLSNNSRLLAIWRTSLIDTALAQ